MKTQVADPMREVAVRAFADRYSAAPAIIARAPGRVNLIGEHTDYNDGFVLPLAIDRAVWIALRPRSDRIVKLESLDFPGSVSFQLDADHLVDHSWVRYVQAVALVLTSRGHQLNGWEGVVVGSVPVGAGLSSSAAIELAAARAFAVTADIAWDASAMARLAQRAENEWVGVNCGIMDQLISACGEAGHALLIDCRSLETEKVPIPSGVAVVIMDTGTRRELGESAYNERRASCEAAAEELGVQALRDVDYFTLQQHQHRLDPPVFKRARHVVTENERTVEAAEALRNQKLEDVGALMNESHESLRKDYEVSRSELDAMVDIARAQDGCYGARMTGAGFGGCAVALVREENAGAFVQNVAVKYQANVGLEPALYVCHAASGASVELDADQGVN